MATPDNNAPVKIVRCNKSTYDSIEVKDPNTVYFVYPDILMDSEGDHE